MSEQDLSTQYAEAVAEFRKQKDDHFGTQSESPIPAEEQKKFTGLKYFSANYQLRLVAQVERLPEGDFIKMNTSDDTTRLFQRYAHLRFEIEGRVLQLTAYRPADVEEQVHEHEDHDHEGHEHESHEEETLFIPFRDTLSGRETYGAGRYLDLEEETAEDGTPFVTLDFNLAYNPYCAYNELYSCPLTPLENVLPIPIAAGEKIYH